MSTSSSTESPFEDPLSQACWLASREMDETLTADETQELRRLESLHPQEVRAFRNQSQQLRAALISLPVKRVEMTLFVAPASSFPTAAVVSEPLPVVSRKTRSGAQRLVVGIVTSLLCGVLVLALNPPQQSDSFAPAMARMSAPSAAGRVGLERELSGEPAAESFPEVASARVNAAPPAASAMGAMVAADGPVLAQSDLEPTDLKPSDREQAVDESSIAPLIQSDNWNVVVVKVDGQDRDMAMDRIQAIVQEHGLRLQKSAGSDQPEWLGVVLTSAVEQSSDVLTAMERDLGEPAAASMESKLDASRSSEIIAAVRESLRYPTRSELHHGRIFVALPTHQEAEPAVLAKSAESAATDPAADSAPRVTGAESAEAIVASEESEEQTNAAAAKRAAKNMVAGPAEVGSASAVVTLVVFEFH